ncbi:MAG: hypothetical protein K8I29_01680 [Alphaproteobacteria bacterium]|uniref:Uncharacterized protein n=1 Tax=Candidatus Nitrobium versatile TaxID=2884831 RepID=A0A953LYY9_9BACT|nr:hypothetical protein [Candidatus Nitrobium versatile]
MNEFLKLEYEQCMALVKYYDERYHTLVKFAAGLSRGVPTLLLGFFGLDDKVTAVFWNVAAFVFLVTMIGLVSILAAITQTRLYFVYPARQLNAIRGEFLRTEAKEFANINQMYLDTSFNAFRWNSSHTIQQAMVALQIGLFAGLSSFAWNIAEPDRTRNICVGSIVDIVVAITMFLLSAGYLWRKSQYHPDGSALQRKE